MRGTTPTRAALVFLLATSLAGACSSDDGSEPGPKSADRPGFVPAAAVAAEPVDGASVWVDEGSRMVYVTDCDVARRITAEGQKYGPSARDPETGKFTPGYAFACP